jgi:hypothetical protein
MVWMGSHPFYVDYWKMTAKHNKNCDFYIITDQVNEETKEDNIYLLPLTFDELKTKVENFLGQTFEDLSQSNVKKLCDIKVIVGDLFSEIIDKYEWWGWTEFDCFLGDFNFYITDEIFDEYDMISYYGRNKKLYAPLVLLKNKHKTLYKQIPDYKNLITKNGDLFPKHTKTGIHPRWGENLLEEIHITQVIEDNNIKIYESMNQIPLVRQGYPRIPFTWDNGSLIINQINKPPEWIEKNGDTSLSIHLAKPHESLVFEMVDGENKFICKFK